MEAAKQKIRKDHIERFAYYYERTQLLPAYQCPTESYQMKVKPVEKKQEEFKLSRIEPEERKAPKYTKEWKNIAAEDLKHRRSRFSRKTT